MTWAAASVAEAMRCGGHANPVAALRYHHATGGRDRAIADALAALATGEVARLGDRSHTIAHVARTPASEAERPGSRNPV